MPRFTQVFGRLGNKTNDLKYFKHMIPNDCSKIVEPFCGSCAMTLNIFPDHENNQYHFNDIDVNVFNVIDDIQGYIDFKETMKTEYASFKSNNSSTIDWKNHVKTINNKFKELYIQEKFVRGSLFKDSIANYNPNHISIFEKATKTNNDYRTVLEQYKDNSNAFVFLDPPYLFSDNSGYVPQQEEEDMTDILPYILEYLKTCKCKVMLIINDLKILRYLYNDFIKGDYKKIYQLSKKKTKHLIITNY